MNDKKISFIFCVNNEEVFEESIRYVKSLNIPVGYDIDIIPIRDALSIASGYNLGMQQSDAKYKVYLHQDVFIINKNFLIDTIAIFAKNPNLGLLGVIGAKTIPDNGVWWESNLKNGKVYDSHSGDINLLEFENVESDYDPVQCIDGLLMMTQYNINWREDLFTGWHFYDLSQCQEYLLAGYDIGVVSQEVPWCIHDCGIVNVKNGFNQFRKLFIHHYQENIKEINNKFLPLVSILIPTFNQTYYLKIALESAINQTYSNTEIIIGDDSTNDNVYNFIKHYLTKYDNIHYFKNERNSMDFGKSNLQELLIRSRGKYINYLFHDDVFHKDKLEKMINKFFIYNDISLVTSHRQLIDGNGKYLPDDGATKKLFENDTLIDGKKLSLFCLEHLTNFIGEPTTVLFEKKKLINNFATFNNNRYTNIADLSTWFSLLLNGKVLYIPETLSYFRQHNEQNSKKLDLKIMGIEEWKNLIDDSFHKGIIENEKIYYHFIQKWIRVCSSMLNEFSHSNIDYKLKLKLKVAFISGLEILLNGGSSNKNTTY